MLSRLYDTLFAPVAECLARAAQGRELLIVPDRQAPTEACGVVATVLAWRCVDDHHHGGTAVAVDLFCCLGFRV